MVLSLSFVSPNSFCHIFLKFFIIKKILCFVKRKKNIKSMHGNNGNNKKQIFKPRKTLMKGIYRN
jgi:hypothetical protein